MSLAPVAQPTIPDGMGSDAPDGSYPRTVTHFAGETIVPREPRRFVSISTGQFDAAASLGLVPVASTHNNSGELVPRYLETSAYFDAGAHRAALDAVIDLGLRTAPDLDLLRSVEPDLMTATFRGQGRRLITTLREIGPAMLTEGKGFNWKQDYLLLASALGRESAAAELLAAYADRIASMRGASDDAPSVSVVRLGPLGLETFGQWSFAGSILTDLGLRRPPFQDDDFNGRVLRLRDADAATEIGALDADHVFWASIDSPVATEAGERLMGHPAWAALPAVRGGRVVEVGPSAWFGHAGPLAAMAVLDDLAAVL